MEETKHDFTNPPPLTQEKLIDAFTGLGIGKGARLVVHSALRSLGPVAGGADAVLDALLACIGPEGLLVVPTFTYDNRIFDPAHTPGHTGILTETLRQRAGAVRSKHPTHSVAAIGKGAAKLVERHHFVPGLGVDSPLGRLAGSGGGILLLGVGHANNSTVHVGEAQAEVPYRHIPFNPDWPAVIPVAGREPFRAIVLEPPGCSRAFGVVESGLRQRKAIKDTAIGRALVQWMSGNEVVRATVELLRSDPSALLCNDTGCYRCNRARTEYGWN